MASGMPSGAWTAGMSCAVGLYHLPSVNVPPVRIPLPVGRDVSAGHRASGRIWPTAIAWIRDVVADPNFARVGHRPRRGSAGASVPDLLNREILGGDGVFQP